MSDSGTDIFNQPDDGTDAESGGWRVPVALTLLAVGLVTTLAFALLPS